MKYLVTTMIFFGVFLGDVHSQKISKEKKTIISALDNKTEAYGKTAMEIWKLAEIGYKEFESSTTFFFSSLLLSPNNADKPLPKPFALIMQHNFHLKFR